MDYDEFLKTLEGNDPKQNKSTGSGGTASGGRLSSYDPNSAFKSSGSSSAQSTSYGQQTTAGGSSGTQYGSAQSTAYGQQTSANSYTGTQSGAARSSYYDRQTTGGYSSSGAQTNTYTGESYYEVRDRLDTSRYDEGETLVRGAVGAAVGAILGIGIWCLIGMAGYIAWIGSLALIGGAYFGFTFMAKGIGKKGMIIVAAIVLLSVYVGTRLTFSIRLNHELNKYKYEYELEDSDIPGVGKIFVNAGDYIEVLGAKKSYNANMVMGYLFTLGAAGTIVFKRKRNGF